MKKTISSQLVPALLCAAALFCAAKPARADINWMPTLAIAQDQARETGKPLMIDVCTSWCHYCKQLDAEVYTDPNVQQLAQRFIMVKADGDDPNNRSLQQQYQVTGYPTLIFLNSNQDKVLYKLPGYTDAPNFCQVMNLALQNAGPSGGGSAGGGNFENIPPEPAQPALPPQPYAAPQVRTSPVRHYESTRELVARTRSMIPGGAGQDGVYLLDDSGVVRLDKPAAPAPAKPVAVPPVVTKPVAAKSAPSKPAAVTTSSTVTVTAAAPAPAAPANTATTVWSAE